MYIGERVFSYIYFGFLIFLFHPFADDDLQQRVMHHRTSVGYSSYSRHSRDGQLQQSRQLVRDQRHAGDTAALVGVLVPAIAVLQAARRRVQGAAAARAQPTAQAHRERFHAA